MKPTIITSAKDESPLTIITSAKDESPLIISATKFIIFLLKKINN